jgi:long-subunit fatty acid transport protein
MYVILSERIGTVGAKYTPAKGVNVDALIAYGFIGQSSTTKPVKSAKTETDTDTDTDTKD